MCDHSHCSEVVIMLCSADPYKRRMFAAHSTRYSFITAKTVIPDLPTDCISRPRLIEQVNNGVEHKLTLISAPGGYGKTTLLIEWSRCTTKPVSWISVNKEDNDLKCFYSSLLISLKKQNRKYGPSLQHLLRVVETTPTELLLPLIIDVFACIEDDFVLILDDYHEITAAPVQQVL